MIHFKRKKLLLLSLTSNVPEGLPFLGTEKLSVINNFDTIKVKKSPVLSTTLVLSIIPAASISQVPGTGPRLSTRRI